jgi:hypothetical protein
MPGAAVPRRGPGGARRAVQTGIVCQELEIAASLQKKINGVVTVQVESSPVSWPGKV